MVQNSYEDIEGGACWLEEDIKEACWLEDFYF